MKKALLITAGLLFSCGIAFASVGLIIDKTPYGAQTDIKCSSTSGVTCSTDGSTLAITQTGASAVPTITGGTINGAVIGGSSPAAATFTTLTATGVMTDVSIYSKASGATQVHLMKIGADGVIYGSGTGTAIIDTGIYSSSAGTGAARTMCISVDGTIYANKGACL